MKLPQINLREPQVLVRSILGVLLFANLVAAAFAFHLVGESPADLDAELAADRSSFRAAQQRLNKSKSLTKNMNLSREQGENFLTSYMTTRRHTFSTIDSEINSVAQAAGMKVGDLNYSLPDLIENSGDLYMLNITANFEGGYAQLVKFVNELDRSPRFLLIEQLQVAPQPKGDILNTTVKMNIFARDDKAVAQ
jgi:Tfp pilus assembly protein PilO